MSERTSAKGKSHETHTHKSSSSNQVLRTITFVLTPFLMLIIFCSLGFIFLSKPAAKIQPYAHMAFAQNIVRPDTSLRTVNKYRDDDAPLLTDTVKNEETEEEHTIIYPYYGDFYATLNCEAAGMNDIPVYCGTANDVLENGAGWYNGSEFIGVEGNVVIAGHNHTYFYNLPNCDVGDKVTLETSYCKLTYEVSERVVFHQSDVSLVSPQKDDRLTMYTCWNNGKLGMSEYRLAIICKLVEREWKEVQTE